MSKDLYLDKLADRVNTNKSTYHSTIKMKPVDIKSHRLIMIKILIMINMH